MAAMWRLCQLVGLNEALRRTYEEPATVVFRTTVSSLALLRVSDFSWSVWNFAEILRGEGHTCKLACLSGCCRVSSFRHRTMLRGAAKITVAQSQSMAVDLGDILEN